MLTENTCAITTDPVSIKKEQAYLVLWSEEPILLVAWDFLEWGAPLPKLFCLSSKTAESSITALLGFTTLEKRDLIKKNQKKHSWIDSECLSAPPVNFTSPAASQYPIFSPFNNQIDYSYREQLPLPVGSLQDPVLCHVQSLILLINGNDWVASKNCY